MSRFAVVISLAMLASCFSPTYQENIACGPDESCPSGTTCAAGVCVAPGSIHTDARPPIDGPENQPDGPENQPDQNDARNPDAVPPDAAPPDAVPPDAPPPEYCDSNDDCATPPNPCFEAGTCNLDTHRCVFPSVDCSGLDSACTRGVCQMADGQCIAESINEGSSCGSTSCGNFGSCVFDDHPTCDETGEKSRTCTDHVCRSGSCVAEDRTDTQACSRDTDDNTCGFGFPHDCGPCTDTGGECVQFCTCTTGSCQAGGCMTRDDPCQRSCGIEPVASPSGPLCPI